MEKKAGLRDKRKKEIKGKSKLRDESEKEIKEVEKLTTKINSPLTSFTSSFNLLAAPAGANSLKSFFIVLFTFLICILHILLQPGKLFIQHM